jgi:aspartyl-tRNA(Asn)/glutamyl-tRNA(Gln) amidotransferase subunit B
MNPTIGLEIHIELDTATKMFCGCDNNPHESEPNTHICPVCLAHPGALPTPNKVAIESTIKLGLALDGVIAKQSNFDRKSYFYPDLPKGYQISQYEKPLVRGGKLKSTRVRRIHLEEDTGKILHRENRSLIDFNRAGVPLMELVTEPTIGSGAQAIEFAKELQRILRYLKIARADMEKGEMRIEANISVSENYQELGTKVEVKNLNSFKVVGEAIDHEITRQKEVLDGGKKVTQETRGWDEKTKSTVAQRTKEEAHDYRYFPEPDIPPLDLTNTDFINTENLHAELPELPEYKRERLEREYELTIEQAALLADNPRAAQFFEETISELKSEQHRESKDPRKEAKALQLVFNYLTSDVFGLMTDRKLNFETLNITPENFADLIALTHKGKLSSRMAKDLIPEMHASGDDPRSIIERQGMAQISDESAIENAVNKVIRENKKAVEDYNKGKSTALKFLIGKTMAELKGKGNPQKIEEILTKALK